MFGIGAINMGGRDGITGEIGRLIVCGDRETLMSYEKIHLVQAYKPKLPPVREVQEDLRVTRELKVDVDHKKSEVLWDKLAMLDREVSVGFLLRGGVGTACDKFGEKCR